MRPFGGSDSHFFVKETGLQPHNPNPPPPLLSLSLRDGTVGVHADQLAVHVHAADVVAVVPPEVRELRVQRPGGGEGAPRRGPWDLGGGQSNSGIGKGAIKRDLYLEPVFVLENEPQWGGRTISEDCD